MTLEHANDFWINNYEYIFVRQYVFLSFQYEIVCDSVMLVTNHIPAIREIRHLFLQFLTIQRTFTLHSHLSFTTYFGDLMPSAPLTHA